MAENLDTSLATQNIDDVTNTPSSEDVNNQTFDNLQSSAGQQMQQTLFWDYQNNKPPSNLPKSDYSDKYPNLLGGPVSSLNKNKPKTWNDIAQESISAVRDKQKEVGRNLILNPGDKVSRYDVNKHNALGYVRGADNEQLHYDRMSNWDRGMIGVRNTLVKASAVAVSSLGYIGKLPFAALAGDISVAGDNWLSNWANEIRDNPINNIYKPTEYDKLTAFEKLGTGSWWADQGADMAGFVIGNLLPATYVSKLGLLTKGSQMIGNALYANKAAQLAGLVEGASAVGTELSGIAKVGYNLANNTKWINGMNMLETGLTSAVSEAVFEGNDAKKRIYQDLLSKGYSPDQAHDIATKNANAVIGLNTAVLLPSSLFEINALLKGGANLRAAAKFIREGGEITKPGVARYAGSMLLGATKGAVVEGVWEENIQNSIQTLADKMSTGKVEPGVANIFSNLISDSIDNFSTQEGQENILGGVVMGVLMGGYLGAKQTRDNYKSAKEILPKYQSSYTSHEQLAKDINTLSNYMRDKSNYVIMNNGKEVLDENGNVKVNTAKLITDIKSLGLTVDLTNTLTNAAEQGDFNLQDIAKSQLIGEFVYNHVSNGMEERMFNKLAAYQNMSEEERNSLGIITPEVDASGNTITFGQHIQGVINKAKQYKDLYNHVESFFPDVLAKDKEGNEYGYDVKSIFQEAVLNRSILDNLDNLDTRESSLRDQMIANVDQNIKNRTGYLQTFLTKKTGPLSTSVDPQAKVDAYLEQNPNSPISKDYNQIGDKRKEYQDALKQSNKRYVDLTNKEKVYQKISDALTSKEEAEKKVKEKETLSQQAREQQRKADEAKSNKEAKEKELSDIKDQLQNPNLSDEERLNKRKEKDQVQSDIDKLNKDISDNTVVDNPGTGMSLEDMIANSNPDNVQDLDPSLVTPDDGEVISKNPKPKRPSDSLPGADTSQKARAAVDRIVDYLHSLESGEDLIAKSGLESMSEGEVLNYYDNLFGEKREGSQVNFKGRTLQIGDRYKGNDDNGTIWKVKGVDINNNLIMYAASDAVKTTTITDLNQLDQMEALSQKEQEKKDKKEDNTPKPLEQGQFLNKDLTNVFRIPNGNTFLEIYHNGFSMSKEQVNKLLTKLSPQEIKEQLYITFSRESLQDLIKRKDELFQPLDKSRNLEANPNLYQKKGSGFRFQIMIGDQILGYGTNPNKYVFLDENGKVIKPENLTDKQFAQIYETNQKNPITLDQFKQNYADSVKLYTELYNRLGDQDSITLSMDQVQELINFKLNPGEYDYSSDKQYKLSELEHNTIQGEVYVLDFQNIYEPGTGKVTGRTVSPQISDITKQEVIDKAIQETFGSNINPNILSSYGRYVAVVQLPNGAIKFVELSTPVLSDEERSSLLTSLQERQVESFSNVDQEASSTIRDEKAVADIEYNRKKELDQLKEEAKPLTKNDKIRNMSVEEMQNLPNSVDEIDIQQALDIVDTIDYTKGNEISERPKISKVLELVNNKFIPIDKFEQVLGAKKKLISEANFFDKEYLRKYVLISTKDFSSIEDDVKGKEVSKEKIDAINAKYDEQLKKVPTVTGTTRRVPKSNLFNDAFNEKLNENLFISIKDKKGVDISMGLTPTGILRLEINDYSDPVSPKGTTIYINKDLSKINNISELTSAINEAIDKNNNKQDTKYNIPFKLENKSFKKSLGKNATIDQYLDMQTSVNPGIVKNSSLEIQVKDFKQTPRQSSVIDIKQSEVNTTQNKVEDNKQSPEAITNTATQLISEIDMARAIMEVTKHSELTPVLEAFINDKLNINPISDISAIKDRATKYINTYENKTEKPEAVIEIGNNEAANILQQISDIKKSIDEVKLAGKNKTLLDQDGNPFADNTARNKYGKALIDKFNSEIKALQDRLPKDSNLALKVVNTNTTTQDRTTLQEFKDFLKRNLPVYIDVQDIDSLTTNLVVSGQTMGMFQTNLDLVNNRVVGGTIGTREENTFKYHEAFHAVFRLLLPENRVKSLLREAKVEYADILKKEDKTLKQAIKEFKSSASIYAGLSDRQAEDRLYEEYMADKFDEWKTNKSVKTSSNIKNIFRKILDWFKAFSTRIGLSRQDMMGLFDDINTGRYKNAKIQANRFTDVQERLNKGLIDDKGRPIDNLFPTQPALKLIKIGQEESTDEFGNIVISPKYLTQSQSTKLVGTVTAVFLRRYQQYKGGISSLIDDIMNDYVNLYNSENDHYINRDDYFDIVDNLDELKFAYSDPESREALKENISYSLQQLGFKENEEEQRIEDDTDDLGDRQVGNYSIETSSIGGFGSLSKFLRRYIASTTYPLMDEKGQPIPDQFGNYELTPGEPLVEAVDSNTVYNGLLKALANVNDQTSFINRLVEYASGNEQSSHFIQRFISDTGLSINEDGTFTIGKNPTLFQMVIKGFNQYRVDYIFSQKDAKNKVSKIFPSNQRDVAQTQFDLWYNSYTTLYQDILDKLSDKDKPGFIADRKKIIDTIKGYLSFNKTMSNADLEKNSEKLSIELNAAYGISLSKNYLKYSIISGMKEENRTKKQQKYFNAFEGVTPLGTDDMEEIGKTVQKQSNPFVKSQVEKEVVDDAGNVSMTDIEVDDANIGRLKKIAENNAIFDETVGSSSFVNAEGKTVYGHQLPTFHLIATTDLTNKKYRNSLKKDPYLKNNYLLNSDMFNAIADNLRIARIDGLRQVTLSQDESGNFYENRSLDVNKREGIVYGSYSDREFLLNLIDLYLYQNDRNSYINEKGETIRFNTASHLIRVLEASNTGDTIALPVQKLFEKGNINNQALAALTNEVVNEYERIQRAKKEISEIENGSKKTGIIQDYHNGKKKGLRFFKTANMLGSLRSELENKAQMEKNYKLSEEEITKIQDQVKDYFRNQVNDLLDLMVSQNILAGTRQTGFTNNLLPVEVERGIFNKNGKYDATSSEKMGLSDNLIDNVGQIFMNDFLNTLAYNQLLLNDPAKGLKDSVDEVKRAKGANGSGPSIESRIIAPELGIYHPFIETHIGIITEPKGIANLSATKKESVDRADAQMWITTKGLRYTLFGLGKLTDKNARFLDKIENGQPITKDDVFGLDGSLEYDGQTNSIKLVYYDGRKYIKTSGALLQKEFTSYWSGNSWEAIPGRESLHDMRQKLEDFEDRNNTVVFMVPKSASKAISEDVMKTDLSDFSDDKLKPLSTKFWRLQLENPSNKIMINDPTQAKQLIDMEQDDSIKVMFRGTETTIGKLRDIYQRASEQRVKNNYIKARNSIFDIDIAFQELSDSIDQNKITPKLAEFQRRAIETLQASGSDSQLIAFFELDEAGNPKYNLNMPLTLDKYTQLFLAYFSKGVTNEKVPGHAVALMSDHGVQMMRQVTAIDPNTQKPTAWITIRADQFKASPQKYFFKDLDTDVFKVGDYYLSDLQHNVPEYNDKGEITGYYSEFMLPAHFAELMDIKPGDKIPDEIAKAFGVRIPSQDKHSFISLKMVDFMPANMGSTGIFAKELIKLSGADFDIDKLYMSISSWYSKQGKLVRYGDEANTNEEKFDEFIHYELNNNKDLKKLINKKLKDSEDYKNASTYRQFNNQSISLNDNDIIGEDPETGEYISWGEVKSKADTAKKVAINEALKELGLPTTLDEFIEESKKGELNNGVLNNIIVDAKIQFLTNDHIRPEIATEAAGVDLLADMTIDTDLKQAVIQESNLDTDSLLGKTSAFKNNKEGANNIGPAVNAMLVYSLLNKYGTKFRSKLIDGTESIFKLSIDGKVYEGYDRTIDDSGNRIMNSISTVVSAMTDNAKERLAAKLNMSMNSISTLCNMLAQGVPLKTVSAILLQPSIKEYFKALKRFSNNFKSAEDRYLNGEQVNRSDIGKKLLEYYESQVPEGQFDPNYTLTTKELLSVTRGETNNPMLQWKVLSDYMKMEGQSKFYSAIAQIIKLSKGLGTNFEYGDTIRDNMDKVGLNMTDNEFDESDIPFDVRQLLTGKDKSQPYHHITANYISIFNQINELAKSLFIEKTDTFRRIKDIVFSNLDFSKDEFNIPEEELKLKRNLISYLSFKAYEKLMKDENKTSRLTSLSNKLLYDQLDTDNSYKDITERLEEARRLVPNNYLLNRFLIKNSTTIRQKGEIKENKNNKDGINKIESNTWAKIGNSMAEKLQDSFRELYNNPNTKQYAVDLFNYLIVKDGLQFKSGSFIKLIPNFMFYDVLRGSTKANDIMKLDTKSLNRNELNQRYKDTFDADQIQLFNQFIDIYLININNSFHIPQITSLVNKNEPKTGIKYTNDLQNEITIDIFADVRKEELKSYTEGNRLIVESVKPTGKLNSEEKSIFLSNLENIKSSGFVIQDITELDKGKEVKRLKVNFPYIITVPKGKNKKSYYKLVRVDNVKGSETETKANNFISLGDTVAKGTKAVYTEIKLKGSRAQTSIAQMFGDLPASDEIRKINKNQQKGTEDTNPSIMNTQTTGEFSSDLNNIFGVTSDGNMTITEKNKSLPSEGSQIEESSISEESNIFYSAINDNFDMSSMDSSFFMDEDEGNIKDNMEGMDVTDETC